MTRPRGPAVLSEAGLHAHAFARPMVEAGFTVQNCTMEEVPERLRTGRYNVLILGRFYTLRRTRQQEQAALAALSEAVQVFVAAGGGVFFALPIGGVLPYGDLLGTYGACIPGMGIEQDDNVAMEDRDGMAYRYAYTPHVSAPVNDGADGIWYPVWMGRKITTRPVRCGKGWQTVVAGTAASRTVPLATESGDHARGAAGDGLGFEQSVPILALRDLQPGRFAVCGIGSGFHVSAPHRFPLAERMLTEGFEGRPSGLRRVLINTFRWLGQPSLAAGTLGGAASDPAALAPQVPRYPDDPPVKWAKREFPPDCRPMRGLIGARTELSTGSGTVAEYAARARARHLDFIVFLEDFKALDAAGLRQLKDACEAVSDDAFFAVPGYTIEDLHGNHFFQYGYRLELPPPELLSPDGRVLAPHPEDGGARDARLDAVNCRFVFDVLGARCRRGTYLHGANPMRIFDLRFCDSIALVTWADGRVVDDARDRYREIEDRGMRLNPAVLTFMDGPEDVERAAASGWRNMIIEPYADRPREVLRKHMAPELEWWGMLDEDTLHVPRQRFDRWQYGAPFQYVTDGPEIRAWTVSVTSRDPEWRATDVEIPPTADRFRNDAAQFRLRISAASDKGLAELRLFDGERRIRCWRPGGAAVFEQELDLVHHQQMHLLLEAVDTAGGRAICLDYLTLRLDWCEFYCADRNNPLNIGFEKDADGLAYGWAGTIYLTYNCALWGGTSPYIGRCWFYGDKMYPAPMNPVHDETSPFDGGIGQGGGGLHLMLDLPPMDPPEFGLMLDPRQEMISPDAAVCGFRIEDGFEHDCGRDWLSYACCRKTGWSLFPVKPTRYVKLRRRAVVFRPRPHALSCTRYEHEISFKRPLAPGEALSVGWLDEAPRHVFHGAGVAPVEFAGVDGEGPTLGWRRGEAVVSWLDGRRPAMFINDGADLLLMRDPAHGGRMGLYLPATAVPAPGAAVRVAMIGVGGTHEHGDPRLLDDMRRAMGLAGAPAYAVEMRQGKVISRELFLKLRSEGEGAAFRVPRADLPMDLPVMLEGMHEHWPVFLVDRGQRRWRPLGVLEGTAYASLDTTAGDWDLFVGHPVTASDPEIVLNLAQVAEDAWMLEIHNPAPERRETDVRPAGAFDLLDWTGGAFSLAAGTSRVLPLRSVSR